jgi:cysteinyl-tRNA synthetase
MALQIYNTFTRQKDEFTPINPPYVGMYVCGPTVYGHSHLGHARSYLTFDVIYRYLLHSGYKVRYIQNITDVGHLQNDNDDGEDKIQKQAKLEKQEPVEIAYKYETSYFEDMDSLNILRPSISCRATGHIPDMIHHIQKLVDSGYAYVSDQGNVYFDIRRFREYGKLSGRKLEETQEGTRVESAGDKRNPEDFALWKHADESHIMRWSSPWGDGYPGWHIECSAMSMKYIGDTLDIHGGGLDNVFPHHECEIAQSEALTGKPFVQYFVHNNLLKVQGTKMGKSLGNFIILKELFKTIDPMVLRFFILLGHYRSPIDFTDESITAASHGFERMKKSIFALQNAIKDHDSTSTVQHADVDEVTAKFSKAMDDDFNTPLAIATVYELLKLSNTELATGKPDLSRLAYINRYIREFTEDILGFSFSGQGAGSIIEDSLIEMILDMRKGYRAEKNFAMSDTIRDQLQELGVTIKDGPDGTTYTR